MDTLLYNYLSSFDEEEREEEKDAYEMWEVEKSLEDKKMSENEED